MLLFGDNMFKKKKKKKKKTEYTLLHIVALKE